MTRDGIEKIQEMTATGVFSSNNGREIAFGKWSYVEPYQPEPVSLTTLTGLVDFVKNVAEPDFIRVQPFVVEAFDVLDVYTSKRPKLCVARTDTDLMLAIEGIRYPLEEFFRRFKMAFYFNEADAPQTLEFLSCISMDHIAEMRDDGISQQVVIKNGAISLSKQALGNSINLMPKCMFPEINVTLPFFLRLTKDGEVILSRAYGEAELAVVCQEIKRVINKDCDTLVLI